MAKTIDYANARRLAVRGDVDPRTIMKLVSGQNVGGMTGERAKKVLKEAGLLPKELDGVDEE